MDKYTAMTKLEESRRALLESIRGLSETQLSQKTVEGTWAAKDLMAHVSTWEVTVLQPLRQLVETGDFIPAPIPDHLAWNDQQARLWQQKTLAQVQDEMQITRQQLIAYAEKLPLSQWDLVLPAPWGGEGTLAQLLAGLAWHEMEHVESIRKGFEQA